MLGEDKKGQTLIGFAAETQDLRKHATAKLAAKNLDLVVANLVGQDGSGFGSDTNQVSLFYSDGRDEALPLMHKEVLADILLDRAIAMRNKARDGAD
jgi:phosphopantothenoylcysteine decarboxylase/phosphopantothenate--cysteine ligase